ncbi:MAG: ribose-phosphate diphosphokinase [Halobacteria archaeon]|nr:ribose-phosphate diphosphokinase [Halobacteria archaeon]
MHLANVEYKRFPDGELLVEVSESVVDAERVVIVASTPNDSSYIELLELIDACSRAETIDLVMPYMGYARQDKLFEKGQPITARALARAVSRDVDSVTTVNVHETTVFEWFDAETHNIDATHLLGRHIHESVDLTDPLTLAPDSSAMGLADSVKGEIGGESNHLDKTRISGDEVEIYTKDVSADNRDVVIIDDMISTGSTMSEAVNLLRRQNAKSIHVARVSTERNNQALLRGCQGHNSDRHTRNRRE